MTDAIKLAAEALQRALEFVYGDGSELESQLAQALAAITEERAWVIEQGGSLTSHPWYFSGHATGDWSDDHLKAVRFCRERDAQNAATSIPLLRYHLHRICEHIWVLPSPPSSEEPTI